jgi:alpha-tubulin suppressor-like RCC1 family protein
MHALRFLICCVFAGFIPLESASPGASYGRVVSWGAGQVFPANGPTNVVAVSVAMDHSLALKADGTAFAWGNNMNGQCTVPAGLRDVSRIAAGEFFSMALKRDGTIVVWGANDYGQRDVPAGLSGVKDISAGHGHCLALKHDGTVAGWGFNAFDQASIPAGLAGVKSIHAIWNYSIALRSNGTVVAWGVNDSGQTSVPSGLANVTAIAGNNSYCMALRSDGTVVRWGRSPSPRISPNNVVAIAAGENHALALTSTNKIIAWGALQSGATTVPSGLNDVFGIAASWHYSAAIVRTGTALTPALLTDARRNANAFLVSLTSETGVTYFLEYKNSLSDTTWTSLSGIAGNGSTLTLTNLSVAPRRIYRVRAQ